MFFEGGGENEKINLKKKQEIKKCFV
jgi:hypothetical protein